MENLDLLWEYQAMQLDLEKYERNVKDTPTRRKLVKLQRFLQQGQKMLADMEKAAKIKQDKVNEIEKKNKAYMEDLEDLEKDFGYYSECDAEELDEKEILQAVKEAERLGDNIASMRKMLAQIKQEIEVSDNKVREDLNKMRSAKAEYEELYAEYQKEMEAVSGELERRKAVVDEAAKKLPKEMLAEYNRIKGFRTDPVAILSNNLCGGCNIQLPSGMTAIVKNSDRFIECENCGRILYIKD